MGNVNIDFHTEIRKRYGNVKRARGFYLYTEKGIRILDMYLDGGRAVLGRRRGQSSLAFKQALDKGLTGNFPTAAENQFEKMLKNLFPDYSCFRVYSSKEKAENILRGLLKLKAGEQTPVFLPFSERPSKESFLFLPYMSAGAAIIVCKNISGKDLPASETVLPAEKIAMSRFFSDLIKELKKEEAAPEKDLISKSKKNKASIPYTINKLTPELERIWTVKGRHLFPKIAENGYENTFLSALDKKILISPDFHTPSVFPVLDSYKELLSFLKEV